MYYYLLFTIYQYHPATIQEIPPSPAAMSEWRMTGMLLLFIHPGTRNPQLTNHFLLSNFMNFMNFLTPQHPHNPFQSCYKNINFLFRIIKRKWHPYGSRNFQIIHQGLGAVVSGADCYA